MRTVGVISLSVLKAITDRTLGRKVPTSYWSCVARTAPISCKAQGGVGHDEARVQVLAGGVDDVVVLLAVDLKAAADVVDFAVAEAHGTVFEDVACAEMGRGPQNEY